MEAVVVNRSTIILEALLDQFKRLDSELSEADIAELKGQIFQCQQYCKNLIREYTNNCIMIYTGDWEQYVDRKIFAWFAQGGRVKNGVPLRIPVHGVYSSVAFVLSGDISTARSIAIILLFLLFDQEEIYKGKFGSAYSSVVSNVAKLESSHEVVILLSDILQKRIILLSKARFLSGEVFDFIPATLTNEDEPQVFLYQDGNNSIYPILRQMQADRITLDQGISNWLKIDGTRYIHHYLEVGHTQRDVDPVSNRTRATPQREHLDTFCDNLQQQHDLHLIAASTGTPVTEPTAAAPAEGTEDNEEFFDCPTIDNNPPARTMAPAFALLREEFSAADTLEFGYEMANDILHAHSLFEFIEEMEGIHTFNIAFQSINPSPEILASAKRIVNPLGGDSINIFEVERTFDSLFQCISYYIFKNFDHTQAVRLYVVLCALKHAKEILEQQLTEPLLGNPAEILDTLFDLSADNLDRVESDPVRVSTFALILISKLLERPLVVLNFSGKYNCRNITNSVSRISYQQDYQNEEALYLIEDGQFFNIILPSEDDFQRFNETAVFINFVGKYRYSFRILPHGHDEMIQELDRVLEANVDINHVRLDDDATAICISPSDSIQLLSNYYLKLEKCRDRGYVRFKFHEKCKPINNRSVDYFCFRHEEGVKSLKHVVVKVFALSVESSYPGLFFVNESEAAVSCKSGPVGTSAINRNRIKCKTPQEVGAEVFRKLGLLENSIGCYRSDKYEPPVNMCPGKQTLQSRIENIHTPYNKLFADEATKSVITVRGCVVPLDISPMGCNTVIINLGPGDMLINVIPSHSTEALLQLIRKAVEENGFKIGNSLSGPEDDMFCTKKFFVHQSLLAEKGIHMNTTYLRRNQVLILGAFATYQMISNDVCFIKIKHASFDDFGKASLEHMPFKDCPHAPLEKIERLLAFYMDQQHERASEQYTASGDTCLMDADDSNSSSSFLENDAEGAGSRSTSSVSSTRRSFCETHPMDERYISQDQEDDTQEMQISDDDEEDEANVSAEHGAGFGGAGEEEMGPDSDFPDWLMELISPNRDEANDEQQIEPRTCGKCFAGFVDKKSASRHSRTCKGQDQPKSKTFKP